MADLYLEFKQEDVLLMGLPNELPNEDDEEEFSLDEEEIDDDDTTIDEGSIFTPLYFYRKEYTGCMHFEVDFDPTETDFAHLVLVRYTEGLDNGNPALRWHVAGIFNSRRMAKELEADLEEDKYDGETPWEGEDKMLDDIEIYSLPIED